MCGSRDHGHWSRDQVTTRAVSVVGLHTREQHTHTHTHTQTHTHSRTCVSNGFVRLSPPVQKPFLTRVRECGCGVQTFASRLDMSARGICSAQDVNPKSRSLEPCGTQTDLGLHLLFFFGRVKPDHSRQVFKTLPGSLSCGATRLWGLKHICLFHCCCVQHEGSRFLKWSQYVQTECLQTRKQNNHASGDVCSVEKSTLGPGSCCPPSSVVHTGRVGRPGSRICLEWNRDTRCVKHAGKITVSSQRETSTA